MRNSITNVRELLTHVAFRYQLACPIFCLMPDHIHLLCCGLADSTNQRNAIKRLRKDAHECLQRIGFEFQRQPYDHVLCGEELEQSAIEDVSEYIARNPERKQLVPIDGFATYSYTACLLPGFPEIRLFEPESWDTVWRTISFLKRTECFRIPDPKRNPS
jgi:REP element-mobilizing transposase RayT